jgi:hypothetical protein
VTFAGVPLWLLGIAALVPAIVFVFVHPRQPATGLRGWLLRWGHPLAWLLLSASCYAGSLVSGEAAYYTALGGLAVFLGFFGAWSTTQSVGPSGKPR